jgi:hypothetical protein
LSELECNQPVIVSLFPEPKGCAVNVPVDDVPISNDGWVTRELSEKEAAFALDSCVFLMLHFVIVAQEVREQKLIRALST